MLPCLAREVRRLVAGGRFAGFLEPGARKVLEKVLLRVGALVEAVPEIAGLRLNPVIVGRDRAVVTDAAVSVREIEQEPLPPIRRLELGSRGVPSAGAGRGRARPGSCAGSG